MDLANLSFFLGPCLLGITYFCEIKISWVLPRKKFSYNIGCRLVALDYNLTQYIFIGDKF